MDMFNITTLAQKEGMCHEEGILEWLQEQRDSLRRKKIRAWDVVVPTGYLYAIENIADYAKIPLYYICSNTFSIALTYSDLLRHERER